MHGHSICLSFGLIYSPRSSQLTRVLNESNSMGIGQQSCLYHFFCSPKLKARLLFVCLFYLLCVCVCLCFCFVLLGFFVCFCVFCCCCLFYLFNYLSCFSRCLYIKYFTSLEGILLLPDSQVKLIITLILWGCGIIKYLQPSCYCKLFKPMNFFWRY